MYDIEGWQNNEGSGDLNYYNLYNDQPSEEAMNYAPGPNSFEYDGGAVPTNDFGVGFSTTQYGGSGWRPTSYQASSSGTLGGGTTSGGSRSSGGGGYIPPTPTGKQSTTTWSGGGALPTFAAPTYNAPVYNKPADYVAPGYDYNRINYLSTQQLAPQARRLRGALYTGIGKIASTDNPWMQKQGRKDLMQGYGTGLSEASAGAARTAQGLYNTEYAGNVDSARTKYQGELSSAATQYQGALQSEATRYGGALTAAQNTFQAALSEWQKSLTQTTTEQTAYNDKPFNSLYSTGGSGTSGVKDDPYAALDPWDVNAASSSRRRGYGTYMPVGAR